MKLKNRIELKEVSVKKVVQSQQNLLYFKKKNLKARINLFQKKVHFNTNLIEPDFIDYLVCLYPYFNRLVSQNNALRMLLKHIPQRVLFLYNMPFNIIYSRKVRKWRSHI